MRCFERGRPLRLSRIPAVDLARVKIRPEILERWAYRGSSDDKRRLDARALVFLAVDAAVNAVITKPNFEDYDDDHY